MEEQPTITKLKETIALGNLDGALSALQTEAVPGNIDQIAQLWFALGQAFENIGRKTDAEIAYVRSL